MSLNIRPSQRELMELQRRCREECQPYINLMVREMIMATRVAWAVRDGDTVVWMQPEETANMKRLRAQRDAIIEKYTRLANGEQPANTACKTTTL